jgi:peptidoglycan/xylan/chitin deacetylase (PgdA/CDA1 family)
MATPPELRAATGADRRWRLRRRAVSALSLLLRTAGVPALLRRRRHRRGDFRVFILEYHDLCGGAGEREGVVSDRRFERHLRHLRRRHRFATVADAADLLRRPEGLDGDVVVVTFDDGYVGNHRFAWPVLRDLGLPAAIYLTAGFLDGDELWFDIARRGFQALCRSSHGDAAAVLAAPARDVLREVLGEWPPSSPGGAVERLKYADPADRRRAVEALRDLRLPTSPPAQPMSWNQARELRDGGIELGAHTVTHPILSKLPADEQEGEMARSRERIGEELGELPRTFAYPNGGARDFDEITVEAARRAGFDAACTTLRGSNRPGCEPLTLRRIGVGSDSIALLEVRLAGLLDEGIRRWLPG